MGEYDNAGYEGWDAATSGDAAQDQRTVVDPVLARRAREAAQSSYQEGYGAQAGPYCQAPRTGYDGLSGHGEWPEARRETPAGGYADAWAGQGEAGGYEVRPGYGAQTDARPYAPPTRQRAYVDAPPQQDPYIAGAGAARPGGGAVSSQPASSRWVRYVLAVVGVLVALMVVLTLISCVSTSNRSVAQAGSNAVGSTKVGASAATSDASGSASSSSAAQAGQGGLAAWAAGLASQLGLTGADGVAAGGSGPPASSSGAGAGTTGADSGTATDVASSLAGAAESLGDAADQLGSAASGALDALGGVSGVAQGVGSLLGNLGIG